MNIMKYKNSKYFILYLFGAVISFLLILWHPDAEHTNISKIDLNDKISIEELKKIIPGDKREILYFGFDLRSSLQEDVRQYLPFIKYLETATGYRFRLHIPHNSKSIIDELGNGAVQFAAMGSVSFLHARLKYGAICLVRGLNFSGKAEYRSVIITAPGSSIRNLEDLRGKSFAFGNITSTQGYLIPRIILKKQGIGLKDLSRYGWTGSHHNCVNAVINDTFDAGGIQDTLGKKLAKEGIIKIIHTSAYYPSSGITAGKDVPREKREKVRKALIDFKPKGRHGETLYNWDKTEMPNGFTTAGANDHNELMAWARRLGLLSNKTVKGIR